MDINNIYAFGKNIFFVYVVKSGYFLDHIRLNVAFYDPNATTDKFIGDHVTIFNISTTKYNFQRGGHRDKLNLLTKFSEELKYDLDKVFIIQFKYYNSKEEMKRDFKTVFSDYLSIVNTGGNTYQFNRMDSSNNQIISQYSPKFTYKSHQPYYALSRPIYNNRLLLTPSILQIGKIYYDKL